MQRADDPDGNQTIIIVEKTEPDPQASKFNFKLKKVDEKGNELSGAKFDVEISGIKNVTVDGTNYSSYNQNIIVNGTKEFSNIEQDPNSMFITVTVKETNAPSEDYEIDPNTYYKYFRYKNNEWQEFTGRDQSGYEVWEKLIDAKFTLKVENKRKPKMKFDLKKVDEKGNELSGAKFDVEISGIKNVTVDGKNYSSYNQNIIVSGTKEFSNIEKDPNSSYITVKIQETDAPSKDYEVDPNTYYKYFRYKNNEWQYSEDKKTWTKCNSSSFTLQVVNKPNQKIAINGYVFLDRQSGDKDVNGPDGQYVRDYDEKVKGVIVELLVIKKRRNRLDDSTNYFDR